MSSYDYRKHLQNSLTSRLGAGNAGELMIAFSIVENEHGADKALDITLEAAQRLLHQCNASVNLPLNRNAQTIFDSLNDFSKSKSVERDGKKLMQKSVDKMNSMIGKIEFRIVYNGVTYGLTQADQDELRVEIPRSLRQKERLKEAYAANNPAKRIKELEIFVRY